MSIHRSSKSTPQGVRASISAPWVALLLLLLALSDTVQAQLIYITNNGTITITGFAGSAGVVTIPDSIHSLPVTAIGNAAFARSYITGVVIPSSVTNIGVNAFAYCPSLLAITVNTSNSVYSSADGVLFDKAQAVLLQCPGGKSGTYTIPNSVNSIAAQAFIDCTSLTSVTIPDTVTSLGYGSFYECSGLTSVTISSKISIIPNQAFEWCSALASLDLSTNVVSIGVQAFIFCSSLTNLTIPDSVTSVGSQAFAFCTGLSSVWIPKTVTDLGRQAFGNCDLLSAITVDPHNPAYSSVDGVLFNKRQTLLIQCPGGKIGNYAVPNYVAGIGFGAFMSCTGLSSVAIADSVTNVPDDAFTSCSSLASVTIGNHVSSIGQIAFARCTGLTRVAIPDSVTRIGLQAFYDCESMSNVVIGVGVTNIDYGAFEICSKLTAITVDSLNPAFSSKDGVLFDKSQTVLLQYPGGKTGNYTVPNDVRVLGMSAFESCLLLTNLTVPGSVTNIASTTFYYCSSLTAIYFGGNAPGIDPSAFQGADNAVVYYLFGTTGWGSSFGGRPTALWQLPLILSPPRTQTAEVGAAIKFLVGAAGNPALGYQWFFNDTNNLSCTNRVLQLANVQSLQVGAYTAVVANGAGSVTSAPAMLNVIAPVERRPVPALNLGGQPGTFLNLDYIETLAPPQNWITLDSIALTNPPEFYFDLSAQLPGQRFYRASHVNAPRLPPVLDLHMVPAITLSGAIGSSVRLDYINAIGPTDAWVTLATVALTNTSQLYFDTSAPGQPSRLYRIVQLP